MIAAAPTTVAPCAAATSIVSRVDPPVVSTSSTTSTRSAGDSEKPRRSASAPSVRSAKIARTPSARPTSWPMTMPPSAGDSTTVGDQAAGGRGDGRAQRLGARGVLEHQRALQVAGAVQAGGEPEVALEEGARLPKHAQDVAIVHRAVVYRAGPPERPNPSAGSAVYPGGEFGPGGRQRSCSVRRWRRVGRPFSRTRETQQNVRDSTIRRAGGTGRWPWPLCPFSGRRLFRRRHRCRATRRRR